MKGTLIPWVAAALLSPAFAYSAPPPDAQVKAAPERAVVVKQESTKAASPRATRGDGRGETVSPELRERLRAKLAARVDDDLRQSRQLRASALALLTTFVAESPKESPEVPEALVRLGELRWEEERDAFVERFQAWEKLRPEERGPSPVPRYEVARDLFARVLHDYPRFSQYDLALYVDGFLATEQGKQDEALDRFGRILKNYPSSRFVPDAHMARAEVLFSDKRDYPAALAEYEKVITAEGAGDLRDIATFKSAWCYWRLGRTDEAARRFLLVFQASGANGGARRGKQLDELQAESLRYLVEVFTENESNTASDMYAFLVKTGGDRFSAKVVRRLADTYYDQGHYERGIEAYELLLKLDPAGEDAPTFVVQICDGYATLEQYPKVRQAYDRAFRTYGKGGPWAKAQKDGALVARTESTLEARLRETATAVHAKAQRDKVSRAEFEAAAGLYDLYLSRYGADPSTYGIHFYLAEIDFYHLGKPEEAARHYLAAASMIQGRDAEKGQGKALRHDALFNALSALERVRAAELSARKGQRDVKETEADKRFAEALALYARLYPNDPALPEFLFRQGKVYYDSGAYDSAVKIWGDLIEHHPNGPYTQAAGELILDSFDRSRSYENVELWARRLKASPAFKGPNVQAKLDALIVQSVFKQGEQKAQEGDHGAAAKAYLRAAKEFPRDARSAQACVNAELEAKRSADLPTLTEAAALVTSENYRSRPESPVGAWAAATALQSMGLLVEAAEAYDRIAVLSTREYPNYQRFEHVRDAAFNAVLLHEATGDHPATIASGGRYLSAYGSSGDADEVTRQVGRAHDGAGQPKKAVDLYRQYVGSARTSDKRVRGNVLLAQALVKIGESKDAERALQSAVSEAKSNRHSLSGEGKYAAAHARYMQGEHELARLEQVQIKGDVRQLSQRLKEKADLLKSASKAFLDTVSMGVAEWTTAALYKVGYAYEAFAKSLRESPAPSNLSPADAETYNQQIEAFVVPIEERSLDAYESGWKKAMELGIYNRWAVMMREALGRLNAELYPPAREIGIESRLSGAFPLPAPLSRAEDGAKL